MAKKPLFKIIPDSIVKGTGDGHLVCRTIPVHPGAFKLAEHKEPYVYLARVILENHLGKIIDTDKFEVHHKDENPANNAISNLVLTTTQDHARGHSKKKKFWKKSPRTKPGQKRKSAQRVIEAFLIQVKSSF